MDLFQSLLPEEILGKTLSLNSQGLYDSGPAFVNIITGRLTNKYTGDFS